MAVVKADAYGHGAITVAQTALEAGASWLGVATVPEGMQLRESGIDAPILILGATHTLEQIQAIAELGVELSVDTWKPEIMAKALEAGANFMNASDGMQNPEMVEIAVSSRVPVVLKFSLSNEMAPDESVILPFANVKFPIVEPVAALKVPIIFKLSFIVTSDVLCPIDMGTPDVAVPIFIPLLVSVVSIFITLLASISNVLASISIATSVVVPILIPPAPSNANTSFASISIPPADAFILIAAEFVPKVLIINICSLSPPFVVSANAVAELLVVSIVMSPDASISNVEESISIATSDVVPILIPLVPSNANTPFASKSIICAFISTFVDSSAPIVIVRALAEVPILILVSTLSFPILIIPSEEFIFLSLSDS